MYGRTDNLLFRFELRNPEMEEKVRAFRTAATPQGSVKPDSTNFWTHPPTYSQIRTDHIDELRPNLVSWSP